MRTAWFAHQIVDPQQAKTPEKLQKYTRNIPSLRTINMTEDELLSTL
jgi:hypothetical protein